MKKVFAEIGFGNDSFISTEFEEGTYFAGGRENVKIIALSDYH